MTATTAQATSLDQYVIVFPKNGRGKVHAPTCWRSTKGVTRPLSATAWHAGRVDMGGCCKAHEARIQALVNP